MAAPTLLVFSAVRAFGGGDTDAIIAAFATAAAFATTSTIVRTFNSTSATRIPCSRVLGSCVAEAAVVYGVMSATTHGMVTRTWLPALILSIMSATLFAVVPTVHLYLRRWRKRLEARRKKLRIEIDGRQAPPLYRMHAQPEELRTLESELGHVETEIMSVERRLAST